MVFGSPWIQDVKEKYPKIRWGTSFLHTRKLEMAISWRLNEIQISATTFNSRYSQDIIDTRSRTSHVPVEISEMCLYSCRDIMKNKVYQIFQAISGKLPKT